MLVCALHSIIFASESRPRQFRDRSSADWHGFCPGSVLITGVSEYDTRCSVDATCQAYPCAD
jgi:hypothetical protein